MRIARRELPPARFLLADDRDAISRTLWEMTNREYRRASPAYSKSREQHRCAGGGRGQIALIFHVKRRRCKSMLPPLPSPSIRKMGRQNPEIFLALPKYPEVYNSSVTLQVQQTTSYFVSSEGSKVETRELWRVWSWKPAREPTMEWTWFAWKRLEIREAPRDSLRTGTRAKEEKWVRPEALRIAPLPSHLTGPRCSPGAQQPYFP